MAPAEAGVEAALLLPVLDAVAELLPARTPVPLSEEPDMDDVVEVPLTRMDADGVVAVFMDAADDDMLDAELTMVVDDMDIVSEVELFKQLVADVVGDSV
ncbi:hypothetical protein K466DRAFT_203709 [Polyporus arcularius HHB13444]|uniref:Uncharacterized protein n=1 Tax=Polyporus arcularius HHB13444 TaxID=1314778 RepID=A0A5C3P711_9APHY|nr:hypothetical protein K466DRAFT_203709 [Polyporus arcularius HHB13444]